MTKFNNILDFLNIFKNEEICHNFLKDCLWGIDRKRKRCPFCECESVYEFEDFKRNRCGGCKKTFSIRKNTIFDDSRMPLQKWFMAIYLINSNSKGVSSLGISKQLGITQKSAWFMLHRIREVSNSLAGMFEGINEIDEAYFGGKYENMHKDKKDKKPKKTAVLGIVNRETGKVKAMKVVDNHKEHLLPKININVKNGSTIITDTYHAYKDLDKRYNHETVKHSAGEYVRKNSKTAFKVHTNTVEGFWAQVRRSIYGIYHWVSEKHIQKYLNECGYRYSTSDFSNTDRFYMFFNDINKKLTYKQLICR